MAVFNRKRRQFIWFRCLLCAVTQPSNAMLLIFDAQNETNDYSTFARVQSVGWLCVGRKRLIGKTPFQCYINDNGNDSAATSLSFHSAFPSRSITFNNSIHFWFDSDASVRFNSFFFRFFFPKRDDDSTFSSFNFSVFASLVLFMCTRMKEFWIIDHFTWHFDDFNWCAIKESRF